ncbi:MAG TPA: DUF4340 domain-containing protein [candidate division Zixibacteria bacterium]|nr:DUF4340 domain-containing protein [candidate division Zixibacteria bacterium]
MRKSTIILIALAIVLLGGWYALHVMERGALSTPERTEFFIVDPATVDSIAFKYATWTHLKRVGPDWHVIYQDFSYPAAPEMVEEMFTTSNGLVLENVIATKAEKHSKFKIDTAGGAILQYFEHGAPVSQMVLGKKAPGFGHTFIRQFESDTVYQAKGDLLKIFRRVPSDWFEKTIFPYDTTEVQTVQWQEGSSETTVTRAPGETWRLTKNGGSETAVADTALLNLKLQKLCPLRADAIQTGAGSVELELTNPGSRLIVTTFDGRSDTLLFNPIEDRPGARIPAWRPGRVQPVFFFFKPSYDRTFSRYSDLVATES